MFVKENSLCLTEFFADVKEDKSPACRLIKQQMYVSWNKKVVNLITINSSLQITKLTRQ